MDSDKFASFSSPRKEALKRLLAAVRAAAVVPLPVAIERLYVFTLDLPGSVRAFVLCLIDADVDGNPKLSQEALALQTLLDQASAENYAARHTSPADAATELLVRELKPPDEQRHRRLAELANVWMHDVKWKDVIAARQRHQGTQRSDGPTVGQPWSWEQITQRVLAPSSSSVGLKFSHLPAERCRARFGTLAERLVCIWSRGEDPESLLVADRIAQELRQSEEEGLRREQVRDDESPSESEETPAKILRSSSHEDDEDDVHEDQQPVISEDRIMAIAQSRSAYRLLYQLHVALGGPYAGVWRLIVVSGTVTFDNLHKILQLVLCWRNVHLYKFLSEAGTVIGKNVRNGLSAGKTKLCAVAPLPRQKFRYDYGELSCIVTVDKVNWTGHGLENVPRCVDGGGVVPPDPTAPGEASNPDAVLAGRAGRLLGDECNLDTINDRLIGKRFGANSYHNKFGKQGPALYVPVGTSQDELHRLTLKTYRDKLV